LINFNFEKLLSALATVTGSSLRQFQIEQKSDLYPESWEMILNELSTWIRPSPW